MTESPLHPNWVKVKQFRHPAHRSQFNRFQQPNIPQVEPNYDHHILQALTEIAQPYNLPPKPWEIWKQIAGYWMGTAKDAVVFEVKDTIEDWAKVENRPIKIAAAALAFTFAIGVAQAYPVVQRQIMEWRG